MLSSLGIYVDKNLIKYAKLKKVKDSYKVESFNVEVFEDLKEALNWCDKLIVLVQDDEHQYKKYGVGFNPVFSIITNIQKAYNIVWA